MNRLLSALSLLWFAAAATAVPANSRELPQCQGIALTREIREVARESKVDPAKAYTKKRRKVPATVACESALWRAMHARHGKSVAGRRTSNRAPGVVADATPSNDTNPVEPVQTLPLRDIEPLPTPRAEDPARTLENNEGELPRLAVVVPAPDLARQPEMGAPASAPVATGVSFEGVGVGIPGYFPGVAPPDTNGHIGATQYVQWNNLSFAVWDKSGKLLYGPAAGNTLFKPLGGACAASNDGDPVVSYDILAGRWVLSQFVVGWAPDFSHQCVAVSATSDALGTYYLYDFVTDTRNFVDYPHTAVWPDGYYMAAHIFSNSGAGYLAGRIYVFEREKMLQGQPARLLSANMPAVNGLQQYGMLAADVDSLTPPPPGEAEFVVGPDPYSNDYIDSTRVAVTWGTTPSITLSPTTRIPVTPLPPGNCGGRSCVPQPYPASSYDYLDDIDLHFMYRLAYRNFGGSPVQESIVATQTGGSSVGDVHDVLRWYELRNAGSSTSVPAVYQQSTYDPDLAWRWMGSIAMDKDHNIALGYSKSSTSIKPGLYMTGRLGTDALNIMGTETTMQAGGGVQYGTGSRWGDYSAMTLDPVDQCTFWFTGEYYQANSSWNWATRIASYKFPSCAPAAAWGTVSGTITSCSNGSPIAGTVITLSNGYAGTSDAAGHYSILVPAGSYSASATDSSRNCLNSSPVTVAVNVSSGGTTTQNFCMNGVSSLQMTASAIDDTTGNGNGIINANECFRLNVTLKNRGCANESAIAATLTTSTAGVTVRQGNSAYANLAVDASDTNATPFRLETAANFVCGTTIELTLNLTYAGGTKSIAIALPTCAANQAIPSSSLSASDPAQTDRIYRDGYASPCGGKGCPGDYGYGIRNYKSFNFTNSSPSASCVTVKINAACGSSSSATDIESVAYLGTYDPLNRCKNYLGDSGIGGLGTTTGSGSYSFNVPANSNFVVVVVSAYEGGTCSQFDGLVSGIVDSAPGPGSCCNALAAPTISAGGPATFCAGGSVTLTSSADSGNQWSLNGNVIIGATGKSYSATASGNYTVKTATADGCISAASAPATVTVNPLPATPVISAGGPATFCAGGNVLLTSSSATGNQWYLDGNPINGATAQTYNATASGNYTVKVTATCASAASAATTVTVNPIPAKPAISAGGSTTICAGSGVVLTSSSATGNQWYLNGSAVNGATATQYTATATGNYHVIATVNGCASPASSATTITVTPLPAVPAINAGGATTFCAGGSVTLTSSSATGNQWSRNGTLIGGATQQTYDAATTGDYTVTTTANGCASSSAATTVTVHPIPAAPVITAGGSTSFCPGGSVTLTSSSATGNQWYLDGNALNGATNQQYAATAAGNYTVIATVNGCTSAASVATIVSISPVPATPTVTAGGVTIFCAGGSVTLTSDSATGNQWYRDGNPIAGATNPQYAATASGDYTVTVTAAGCASAASNTTTVTVIALPPTPVISANGPASFCTGGNVTLTSSSATGNQWYLDGNPLAGETNQQYVATVSGNYTVVVTSGACASAVSAATTVSSSAVPATPVITPGGPTTFCSGNNVVLTSNSAAGNQWYLNGNAINGATAQQYTATAAGNYTVIVTSGGCSSNASATVAVAVDPTPATPTIAAGGATSFCTGGSVTLTSSSATGNQWYLGGNPIDGATAQTYNATASGNYTVIVTTGNCASAASAAKSVTVSSVPAQPAVSAGGATTFCAGGSVTLTSSAASGNQWYLNGNAIIGATNQQYAATASGNYTVIVTTNNCSGPASAATSVTVNPTPATPTISAGGATTFCAGGSVTLTSSSASGNQWFFNGTPINGATSQQYVANSSGNYTVKVTANGCSSAASAATTVTVNTLPPTPAITAGGATTFCSGGSVTLTSNNPSGNQWFLNGSPINGATAQQYAATASGNYTVQVNNGCASAVSVATAVTVMPSPATPVVTASGPVTFCSGGSVTLTSSSASGNQWYRNNSAINDANGTAYVTTIPGDYMVIATGNGCSSQPSAVTTVTINTAPNATISVPTGLTLGNIGNASVSGAGTGATYNWTITNGTIISGATTNFISFTATAAGTLTLACTVAKGPCADTKTATVTVTPLTPSVTVAAVYPAGGSIKGGTNVTIYGGGFLPGATVTIGGTVATNVVIVAFDRLTARTPAHAAGYSNVTVTNTNASSATMSGAFRYAMQTDPNGDSVVDPSDIFYLVSYLFTRGPAPVGTSGILSGDANGDAVVDPADIFYLVNYLFAGGSTPYALTPPAVSDDAPLAGTLSFGDPVHRHGRDVIPVIYTAALGSAAPQAVSIALRNAGPASIHHPASTETRFAITRRLGDRLAFIALFDAPLALDANRSAVVAEIEMTERVRGERIELDPELTLLSNGAGTRKVTPVSGQLSIERRTN